MTRSARKRHWLEVMRVALAFVVCFVACDHSDVIADVVPQPVIGEAGEGGASENGGASSAGEAAGGAGAAGGSEAGALNAGSANGGAANGGTGAGQSGAAGADSSAGAAGEAGASGFVSANGKFSCLATLKGYSYNRAVASDAQSNWFVTGGFQGTVDFGGQSRTSTGNAELDLFVAKYTANCALAWVHSFSSNASAGPNSVDQGLSIAVAPNGDVLFAGYAAGALDLGGGTVLNQNGGAFYARYTTNGTHVWSHLTGKTASGSARGIAVAPNGDFALAAEAGLDPRNDPAHVALYDANATLIWQSPIDFGQPSLLNTDPFGVAVDPNENVFVTGSYCSQSGTCASSTDAAFLAAYHATGAFAWSKTVLPSVPESSSTFNEGEAVAADANRVVAVGVATPPVDFGAGPLTGFGNWDAFFARYTSSGALVKAFLDGETAADFASGVALDEASNLFMVGQSGSLGVVGGYTPSGDPIWLKPLNTPALHGVALAPNRMLGAVGEFFGASAVDFGDGVARTTSGTQDSFLVVYAR